MTSLDRLEACLTEVKAASDPDEFVEAVEPLLDAAPALLAVASWAQTMLSAEVVSTSEFMALQEEGFAALAALDEALT